MRLFPKLFPGFWALLRGDTARVIADLKAEKDCAMADLRTVSQSVVEAAQAQIEGADHAHRSAREGIHFFRNMASRLQGRASAVARAAEDAVGRLEAANRKGS